MIKAPSDAGQSDVGFNLRASRIVISKSTSITNTSWGATFTPANAKRLDQKVDDGEPRTGKMIHSHGWRPATTTQYNDGDCYYTVTGKWNLQSELAACLPRMKILIR
jgi:hypothetical protein